MNCFIKVLLLFLPMCYSINICQDECQIETKLDVQAGPQNVVFEACEGHIVKLKFLPEKELTDVTVSVHDDGRKIYHKHGFGSSEDVELFTVSSNPTLQYNFNNLDISGLEILYNCHSNMTTEDEFFNGTDSLKTVLEPNTQLHYTLSTSNDIYNVKIELDTTYPTGAFAAVSLGNGKFALGFNEMNLAVPQSNPGLTSQEVTIVTNNNVLASDTAVFQYDLGDTTTSTEEPSSTSTETAVTEDQITTIYVIAVEEMGWRQNHYDNQEFQDTTWDIMIQGCPELVGSANLIHYSVPYTCRKQCSMTNDQARGCAMIEMHLENIPDSIFCDNIADQTRIEYFRSKLRDMTGDLRKSYGAKRVSVDSCNDITWQTDWVWVSVGLVAGVFLLSLGIMFSKKVKRKSWRSENLINEKEKDDEESMHRNKKSPWQRDNAMFERETFDAYE